jgi:hypothetical protein
MHNRTPADLFQRLPGHFRTRDAVEGRPLEALMGVFREELGILEQDIDQLYDNWFVETCEPWVLPYIAALVGATPMRDIGEDQAGLLRAYIANVLQYRQAKGTAAVVEQVARDVSGWPVVAVEFFQRVATSQNVNHIRPMAPAFAHVRNASARISRSPFSAMAHSAAAGSPDGWAGRYNIPHLGLFVWRQSASPIWPVENDAAGYLGGAQPPTDTPDQGLLTFDPLGRDMPLVNRPAADLSIAARMTERTVPAPLLRDQVFAALNAARVLGTTPGRWFEDAAPFRVRLNGAEVEPVKLYCCNLEKATNGTWHRPANAGEVLVDPELGRLSLHPTDEGKAIETGFAHATPFDIGGGAYDRRTSLEKWLPDFVIEGEPPVWQIGVCKIDNTATDDPLQGGPVVTTMREAVQRWNDFATEGSRGIITVLDNASYFEKLNAARRILLPKGSRLAIVAAAWPVAEEGGGVKTRSPGQLSPMHRRPVLVGPVMIDAADAGEDTAGSLVIDGLIIGGTISARPGGDLGPLRLYNCTIGPNGTELEHGIICTADNTRMSLVLDRCITAKVDLPHATGTIEVTRSIIGEDLTADTGGTGATVMVLRVPQMDTTIAGTTLFGRATCRTIHAENSILTGIVEVEYRQTGCVRFCYVNETSALPRRYRCVPRLGDKPKPRPVFVSTRFQDPGFGQLNLCTPLAILEGAEDGMEMGVGYANRDPARRANMRDAVQQFSPFGLVSGLIYIT